MEEHLVLEADVSALRAAKGWFGEGGRDKGGMRVIGVRVGICRVEGPKDTLCWCPLLKSVKIMLLALGDRIGHNVKGAFAGLEGFEEMERFGELGNGGGEVIDFPMVDLALAAGGSGDVDVELWCGEEG